MMEFKAFALKAPEGMKDKLVAHKYLDKLAKIYSEFISKIDDKDIVEINKDLINIVKFVESIRVKIKDEIITNRYGMNFERKRLGGTSEKVLKRFEDSLLRQLQYIDAGKIDIDFPTIEHVNFDKFRLPDGSETSKRMPMAQTPQKLERLVLQYGKLYGLDGMPDYGKIVHSDTLLAKELISAFMGLDLLKDKRDAVNHVKSDLKNKVKEVLNPSAIDLPYNLPKKPPGKGTV